MKAKHCELVVAGARATRRFLFDERLSWKARGLFAWIRERAVDGKVTIRELQRAGGDGEHAVRTGVEELETNGYVSVDAGEVEAIIHPVEGGIYEDRGHFRWMEVLAVGKRHGHTVMVGKLHGGLIIAPVELWHTAAFGNPRLRDRLQFDAEYRGSGRFLGRHVGVLKVGDEILLEEHPN